MPVPRISASSYSNTAPLVWSFLYGLNHGKVEIILDNAPARSAELLAQDRVDAALVPVIAYQTTPGLRLVPDVCVGAKERVRSVALVTRGKELSDARSVALDISSKTSVTLTKIIFREFLGFEPEWIEAAPDLDKMLSDADCALLIGDPALKLSAPSGGSGSSELRVFDLAELWKHYTGFGFVFAMWMTRAQKLELDFAAARDEGLAHIDEIVSNYEKEIKLPREDFKTYLTENISYSVDDSMRRGMELYFELAYKNSLIAQNRPLLLLD
ncbi:MAG TPA: menaquinone biosynthesis protein [Pyrinomonadaceae bacterium]|jgi:predicted solute-binding protein|nr:menaquinone biosynthesis protein [Pyrinomonadaceae bacterium]